MFEIRALSAWDEMNAKVIRKPQIGPLGRLLQACTQ